MQKNITQLHDVTPEQLKQLISEDFKIQLDSLKTHFKPKEPTQYLTRKGVTEMLNINISSVHNWTKKGILKAYQISGRLYYKRDEIENAMILLKR